LGALFCILLGAVLIGTGLTTSSSGDVGLATIGCGSVGAGTNVPCPTGQISFTKTVLGNDPSAPSSWSVHVTSGCLDPATNLPVNQTVNVPTGGTANTGDLFIFANTRHSLLCTYAYVEDPIPANCTAVFDPASPQTIATSDGLKVALTNTCTVRTTAPPSSSTPAPSTSVATTHDSPLPTSSSTTAPISNTGPHEQVRASVWIGVALCMLGLTLLVVGRRRTGRRAS
jgi:hypothetical protein